MREYIYLNGLSNSCAWDVDVPHCLAGCHKLAPQRRAPRTANGFVSTCVMKDIWSIKAYSFSVPFY